MSKLTRLIKKVNKKYCSAVVVAAGSSTRMGEDKLAMEIGGVPVLARTLQAISACPCVDEIVVVTRADKIEAVARLCEQFGLEKVRKVVRGGENRTQSALAGASETNRRADIICIHDGARPFVTQSVVNDVVKAAARFQAAAPAMPVTDTVRIAKNGVAVSTPDREEVFSMQTPQAFQADIIKAALTDAVQKGRTDTDDCMTVEAMGITVHLTPGDPENIKLTTQMDLELARKIQEKREREQA